MIEKLQVEQMIDNLRLGLEIILGERRYVGLKKISCLKAFVIIKNNIDIMINLEDDCVCFLKNKDSSEIVQVFKNNILKAKEIIDKLDKENNYCINSDNFCNLTNLLYKVVDAFIFNKKTLKIKVLENISYIKERIIPILKRKKKIYEVSEEEFAFSN